MQFRVELFKVLKTLRIETLRDFLFWVAWRRCGSGRIGVPAWGLSFKKSAQILVVEYTHTLVVLWVN